jgi:NitT/TauT family transport system permease protein
MSEPISAATGTHAAPGWGEWLLSRLFADGLVLIVLLAWWLMARRLPPIVLPDPWSVAKALAELFYDPASLQHVAATGLRVVWSVVIATVIAAVLAGLAYYVPLLQDIVLLRIQPFLGAMPSVGWAIVGLIWFKVSDFTVVFIQVAILIPFCLINFTQGLRDLDAELIEMGRSFTRSKRLVFTKLIVPLLLPYAVASLRIAYGVCWKIALVSELFGADTGLGYVMLQAQIISDVTVVIATCLAIVLLFGAGDYFVLRPLSRMVTR